MKQNLLLGVSIAFIGAVGTSWALDDGPLPIAQRQTNLSNDLIYSEIIEFRPGQSHIDSAGKDTLRRLITEARDNHQTIEDVNVAVWSDSDFPKVRNSNLRKSDRDLANQRGDSIKNCLKDDLNLGSRVDVFSLAEQANWLARLFNTDDAELKTALGQQNAKEEMTHAEFQIIRAKGAPSKAVITVRARPIAP